MRVEEISDKFTKYHLAHEQDWGDFKPVLHRLFEPDDYYPHDHPWDFTTHILKGGYVEEVYTVNMYGTWSMRKEFRAPGTVHHVKAEHIHRIVEFPEGECWTLALAGQPYRHHHWWNFDDYIAKCWPWYSSHSDNG